MIRGNGILEGEYQGSEENTNFMDLKGYYFFLNNEHGDTELIVGQDGRVRNRYAYDVFGNYLERTEEVENRYGYTGEAFDTVTNQYYLRARYYNPQTVRFTQEDLYRGDGLNLYAYCSNNPVMYIDPSGYKKQQGSSCPTGIGNKNQNNVVTSPQDYADNVAGKTSVAGDYTDAASASDILRGELSAAGISNPPYQNAAHHIVPWNDPRALDARTILDEYDIEYNSAVNGVFLPMKVNAYTGDAALHIGNHSSEYIDTVTLRLQAAVDAGASSSLDIVSVLNGIREELLEGKIKLNKGGK